MLSNEPRWHAPAPGTVTFSSLHVPTTHKTECVHHQSMFEPVAGMTKRCTRCHEVMSNDAWLLLPTAPAQRGNGAGRTTAAR